jgi:predicted TPR repeat methyltransferase
LDVYRITDKLDDDTSEVLVKRLEARGRHPVFVKMMHQYFDIMQIDEARRVLDLGCGTGVAGRSILSMTRSWCARGAPSGKARRHDWHI